MYNHIDSINMKILYFGELVWFVSGANVQTKLWQTPEFMKNWQFLKRQSPRIQLADPSHHSPKSSYTINRSYNPLLHWLCFTITNTSYEEFNITWSSGGGWREFCLQPKTVLIVQGVLNKKHMPTRSVAHLLVLIVCLSNIHCILYNSSFNCNHFHASLNVCLY